MPMMLEPHAVTGHLLPIVQGADLCQKCGHETLPVEARCDACGHIIPGSQNSLWELHKEVQRSGKTLLATHRPDILYMFGPRTRNDHWLTLYSLAGRTPHVMLHITHLLRVMARSKAGRRALARFGIGVASTHDGPDQGYQMPPEQALEVLARPALPSASTHTIAERARPDLQRMEAELIERQEELQRLQTRFVQQLEAATGVSLEGKEWTSDAQQGVLMLHAPRDPLAALRQHLETVDVLAP